MIVCNNPYKRTFTQLNMEPYSSECVRLKEESDRLRVRWMDYCTRHFHRFDELPTSGLLQFKKLINQRFDITL